PFKHEQCAKPTSVSSPSAKSVAPISVHLRPSGEIAPVNRFCFRVNRTQYGVRRRYPSPAASTYGAASGVADSGSDPRFDNANAAPVVIAVCWLGGTGMPPVPTVGPP